MDGASIVTAIRAVFDSKNGRRWIAAVVIAAAASGIARLSMVMKDEAASFPRDAYCAEDRDRNVEAGEALLHGLPHRRLLWSMPAYSVSSALVCHPGRGGGGLAFPAAALGLTVALVAGMGRFVAGGLGGAFAVAAYCFLASSFGGAWDSFFGDRWFYQATIALVGFAAAWRAGTADRMATPALGLSMGISLATLSPLLFYPALCAGWEMLRAKERRKAVLTAALLLGIPCIILLPWGYLNSRIQGRFVFLEDQRADTNIMAGAAGVVSGPVLANARSLIGAASEDAPWRAAVAWVLAHPLMYLQSVLKRIHHVLSGSPIPFALAIIGGTLGRRDPVARSLSGLAAYYCGMHFLMPIERRYLFPILPVLAVLPAAGLIPFSCAGARSLWPRRWFAMFGGPVVAFVSLALALCAVFPARAAAPDALARELRLHPEESWLWAYKGRNLLAQNNPRDAATALRRCVALDPENRGAALLLASADAINSADCRESDIFREPAAILRADERARVAILCHLARDQVKKARQRLQEWRRLEGNDVQRSGPADTSEWNATAVLQANLEMAVLLLSWPKPLGQRAALNMKLHVPELLPPRDCYDDRSGKPSVVRVGWLRRQAELSVIRGISFYNAGRRREAEESFRKAIRYDWKNVSAWLSLGAVLSASGRDMEAISCYDRMLTFKPDRPNLAADVLAARANAHQSLGRAAEARRDRVAALRAASPSWRWREDVQHAVGF